jgi:hypothetical protein
MQVGVAAFAVGDGLWGLEAPSGDGVEDDVYYKSQFYSISYLGDVEAWEHDADSGEFTRVVFTPRGWTTRNTSTSSRRQMGG